ncbi:MAG: DUF4054 domain-containing protein [Deltaproteobacteria bacterium]|nr:DUF4054 domain-containing protein [Deltaproteobacteria bacterium]
MAFTVPTIAAFKAYFARDFKYAPENDASNLAFVTDADINKAYGQASANFNTALFTNDDDAEIAYLWLSAFYLVYDLQSSAQGLTSQSNYPISSKSVGSVSIGFTVPEKYSRDPYLSIFTGNGYGLKYLSLLLPHLVGNIAAIGGATLS